MKNETMLRRTRFRLADQVVLMGSNLGTFSVSSVSSFGSGFPGEKVLLWWWHPFARVSAPTYSSLLCIVWVVRATAWFGAMAGDGKGKVGKKGAEWLSQSHARFRAGVRDPRSTHAGPGIWETPTESPEEIAKSILRPKSAARQSSTPYPLSWRPERVAEPQGSSDSQSKSAKGKSSSGKGMPMNKGKQKGQPLHELHGKTIKEMRFENIVSLSF